MTGKELYEKYKGSKLEYDGRTGTVCGHSDYSLILAVEGKYPYDGWRYSAYDGVILTHLNNKNGYWYVGEEDIID